MYTPRAARRMFDSRAAYTRVKCFCCTRVNGEKFRMSLKFIAP